MKDHSLKTDIASELTLAKMKIHQLTVRNAELEAKLHALVVMDAIVAFILGVAAGLLLAATRI